MIKTFSSIKILIAITVLLFPLNVYGKKTVHISKYVRRGSDVTNVLQKLVNENSKVIIDKGTWYISSTVYIPSGTTIEGRSKKKSILKASETALSNSNGQFRMLVTSNKGVGKTLGITVSNLTFDLNRHPAELRTLNKSVSECGVNALYIEGGMHVILRDCIFIDYCIYDNSGKNYSIMPVVFAVNASECTISGCSTENCTFLYVNNCLNVTISENIGKNSFGTWIETEGGRGHKILNNVFNDVWCQVSTIGINSTGCEVFGNSISNETKKEISCITLGHDDRHSDCYLSTKADSCYVHDNIFRTSNNLGILVQSGSHLRIEDNQIEISPSGATSYHSGIGIAGDETNFHHARIKGNIIRSINGKGNGIIGINMYESEIENNTLIGGFDNRVSIRGNKHGTRIVNNTDSK